MTKTKSCHKLLKRCENKCFFFICTSVDCKNDRCTHIVTIYCRQSSHTYNFGTYVQIMTCLLNLMIMPCKNIIEKLANAKA